MKQPPSTSSLAERVGLPLRWDPIQLYIFGDSTDTAAAYMGKNTNLTEGDWSVLANGLMEMWHELHGVNFTGAEHHNQLPN